jgi:arsenate reductase-like glutaredoxin family protein
MLNQIIPRKYRVIEYVSNPIEQLEFRLALEYMSQDDLKLVVRQDVLSQEVKSRLESTSIEEILDVLTKDNHIDPQLLQRPILVDHELKRAVVGRSQSRIEELLQA